MADPAVALEHHHPVDRFDKVLSDQRSSPADLCAVLLSGGHRLQFWAVFPGAAGLFAALAADGGDSTSAVAEPDGVEVFAAYGAHCGDR
jgi:hypothetical protein